MARRLPRSSPAIAAERLILTVLCALLATSASSVGFAITHSGCQLVADADLLLATHTGAGPPMAVNTSLSDFNCRPLYVNGVPDLQSFPGGCALQCEPEWDRGQFSTESRASPHAYTTIRNSTQFMYKFVSLTYDALANNSEGLKSSSRVKVEGVYESRDSLKQRHSFINVSSLGGMIALQVAMNDSLFPDVPVGLRIMQALYQPNEPTPGRQQVSLQDVIMIGVILAVVVAALVVAVGSAIACGVAAMRYRKQLKQTASNTGVTVGSSGLDDQLETPQASAVRIPNRCSAAPEVPDTSGDCDNNPCDDHHKMHPASPTDASQLGIEAGLESEQNEAHDDLDRQDSSSADNLFQMSRSGDQDPGPSTTTEPMDMDYQSDTPSTHGSTGSITVPPGNLNTTANVSGSTTSDPTPESERRQVPGESLIGGQQNSLGRLQHLVQQHEPSSSSTTRADDRNGMSSSCVKPIPEVGPTPPAVEPAVSRQETLKGWEAVTRLSIAKSTPPDCPDSKQEETPSASPTITGRTLSLERSESSTTEDSP